MTTIYPSLPQISPVILNTVMTITSAMTAKPQDQQDQEAKLDVRGLWSIMNIYECNFWFLGVDQATEVTESFREQDARNIGESFSVEVKVWALFHRFCWWLVVAPSNQKLPTVFFKIHVSYNLA